MPMGEPHATNAQTTTAAARAAARPRLVTMEGIEPPIGRIAAGLYGGRPTTGGRRPGPRSSGRTAPDGGQSAGARGA